MEYTGFQSYWMYNIVKYIHFKSKKINVFKGFPKKGIYLKKWNEEMINRKDSLYFLKIDKKFKCDHKEIIKLFSIYYLNDKNFYVTNIFEDEFELYKKNKWELENITECIENDFLKIVIMSLEKNIPLKNFFKHKNSGLPIIFKLYDRKKISINSLLAFYIGFNIKIKDNSLNIIEREKFKKYELIFDKYRLIVNNYFDFDIKKHLKKYYDKKIK